MMVEIQRLFFFLKSGNLVRVEAGVLREDVLDLGAAGPRGVGEGVALVEDSPGVRPARGQVVGHQAGDAEVPADLEDLVQHDVDGLPYLLVRDHVDAVEDHHTELSNSLMGMGSS